MRTNKNTLLAPTLYEQTKKRAQKMDLPMQSFVIRRLTEYMNKYPKQLRQEIKLEPSKTIAVRGIPNQLAQEISVFCHNTGISFTSMVAVCLLQEEAP